MVRGASRNTPLEIETICVHMYLPATCICFYVHTHIHTHTPMQTCVSMLTDVYIKVCTLIDPHLHTCITQAHTHACTHTHTHTHKYLSVKLQQSFSCHSLLALESQTSF